jgi:MerR family copper efflux transcriptional regulator
MNIGQAADASGVTAKMIRYYESIGLIAEAGRTDSGYRQYTDTEVQTLRFIKRSRDLGFSLARIKTLLALWEDRGRKSSDVKKLARQYIAELDQDIGKLQSIRDQLQHMANSCHGDHRPECPIIDDLAKTAPRGGRPGTRAE